MADIERIDGGPRSAIVVGAGIVGLSTAWFLQERGVDVTVVDRDGVAAGASWGNAGWIAPALTSPLNSPSMTTPPVRRSDPRMSVKTSMLDPAGGVSVNLSGSAVILANGKPN